VHMIRQFYVIFMKAVNNAIEPIHSESTKNYIY